MGRDSRDRVTIELRGMRERLHTLAELRKMPTAALVRKAIAALLDDELSDAGTSRNGTTATVDGQVAYIAARLSDLGAVYIHGGVDAGDEDDDETREGKIKLFHDDRNTMVMVANPAAASEGISLHRVCHHAIYLDRTFNAAHYLQSEDRIHRFGLAPDQETIIEIVECSETVDETVRERLGYKVNQMAEALDDSSLKVDPIAMDPNDIDDYEDYSVGLKDDDIQALLRDLSMEAS